MVSEQQNEHSDKISVAVSEAKEHDETTSTTSDRAYYVLGGELVVSDENKEFIANPGDVAFIPANTEYNFKGTFKAVLINSPPFILMLMINMFRKRCINLFLQVS